MPYIQKADAGWPKFLQSEEFASMSEKERAAMLKAYDASSPEQRAAFIEKLTPLKPTNRLQEVSNAANKVFADPSKEALKGVAATGIDILGAGGGAALGGWKGGRGGMVTGEVLGSILADRVNRGLGLRDQKTVDTPIPGISVENKQLLGPVTTGDVIAGGTPLLARGVGAVAKTLTRPGQTAIQKADETNIKNQQEYADKVETTSDEIWGKINREYERVDQKDAASLETFQNWQNRGQLLKDEFLARRQKILDDAALTESQRKVALQQETQQYHDRMTQHQMAHENLAKQGTAEFENIGGHGPVYDQVSGLAAEAGNFSTEPIRKVAEKLGVSLREPAEGTQSKFTRLTDALQEFGEPKAGGSKTVYDDFGNPTVHEVPGVPGEVPLGRLIATQRKLGEIIGDLRRSGGEEYGVAKRLFAEFDNHLTELAKTDPKAAAAVNTQREANLRFMREENERAWAKLWKDNAREIQPGVWEVNDQGLRDGFNKLKDDRFFQKGWSPEEQAHLQQTIYQAPQEKIGSVPTMQPVDSSQKLRDLDFEYSQQTTRHMADQPPTPTTSQPELDKLEYPAYPDGPPEAVSPSLKFDSFGPAITTKIAVGELAGRMMGLGGPAPGVGLATAGVVFGLPYVVSKGLLALPGGEQVLRNIIAKKQRVTPEFLAGITGYLRAKGAEIRENEDN